VIWAHQCRELCGEKDVGKMENNEYNEKLPKNHHFCVGEVVWFENASMVCGKWCGGKALDKSDVG